jgi:hypothetical protein
MLAAGLLTFATKGDAESRFGTCLNLVAKPFWGSAQPPLSSFLGVRKGMRHISGRSQTEAMFCWN